MFRSGVTINMKRMGGIYLVKKWCVPVMVVLVISGVSTAQDSHYWTSQYGTRSTLLGGGVVGSVADLSGTYYNPGGLALLKDSKFILAANVFQYTKISLTDVAQEDFNLDTKRLTSVPPLVAGLFDFKWLRDHKIAYSILSRNSFRMSIDGKMVDSRDVIPGAIGDEYFVGDVSLGESLSEIWAGLTWAHSIGERTGVGITQYVAIRSQSSRFQVVGEALTTDNNLALLYESSEYQWQNYRLLWKLGVAWDFDALSLGLSVTSPSVNISGNGALGFNSTTTGQDLDGDGFEDTELTAHYEDGVDTEYKSPFSVGIGSAYDFGNTTIHLSGEWFHKVDEFDVLRMNPFESQSSGEVQTFKINHELNSVLNYGIGIEHVFSDRFSGFAGLSRDFSASVPGSDTNLSITNWDLYHFAIGTTFRIKRSSFTLGFGYSFGRHSIERDIDFIVTDNTSQQMDSENDGNFRYRNLKLILGFSI